MAEGITWVALDAHKKKHAVAVLDPGSERPREFSIPNEVRAMRRLARKLVRRLPERFGSALRRVPVALCCSGSSRPRRRWSAR